MLGLYSHGGGEQLTQSRARVAALRATPRYRQLQNSMGRNASDRMIISQLVEENLEKHLSLLRT